MYLLTGPSTGETTDIIVAHFDISILSMKSMKIIRALLTLLLCVCVQAEEVVSVAEAARIYRESCDSCHGEGVYGAPRPGVKADWAPRMNYGVEGLYWGAIDGIIPQMPERGQCMECTDRELMAVVDWMLTNPKANQAQPGADQ